MRGLRYKTESLGMLSKLRCYNFKLPYKFHGNHKRKACSNYTKEHEDKAY